MDLETSTGRTFADPTGTQIAEELGALPRDEDAYAVLSRDDEEFIQTAGSPSEGFSLEYRDGSSGGLYRSTRELLPLDLVTRAFQLYAAGDPSWRSLLEWQGVDPGRSRGFLLGLVPILIVVALPLLASWCRVEP